MRPGRSAVSPGGARFNTELWQGRGALRWSTRLIIAGVLISAIGVLPPYFSGPTIDALESAAGFISVGILILLLGVGLRKLQRAIG